MQLKQKVPSLIKIIKNKPIWVLFPAAILFVLFVTCAAVFLSEKPVWFSYSGNTCARQFTLFPSLSRLTQNNLNYEIENRNIVKLGDFHLLSTQTCFIAKTAPVAGNIKLSIAPLGSWLMKKNFRLIIPQPPSVKDIVLDQSIPTQKPLAIEISTKDFIYEYSLEVDGKLAACPVKGSTISCDIAALGLLQGKQYDVKLIRTFNGKKVATLIDKSIKTLSATSVVGSSVASGQVVYDKPKVFTFDFDKKVIKGTATINKIVGDTRAVIVSTSTLNGNRLTVAISDDLERDVAYEVAISGIEAEDGSTLAESSYKLGFRSSDGPTVKSVNVGTSGVPLSKTIIITFDQTLASSQDITKFVTVSGVAASVWKSNNQVFVGYSGASMCTDVTIQIAPGLYSDYGIVQGHSWSYPMRTVCHTTSAIGYSRGGRAIIAYTFGSGSQTILYTGSIHGNEYSAKYLMDAWVNELEVNVRNIPSDKKIVVIPNISPDGFASGSRYNSAGVDLNRNFPTVDWQSDIYSTSNQLISGGGGATPLSEPESQAIASFTAQLSPKLTMSFHAAAGYTIGNQAGESANLAAVYSQLTGYRNMTGVEGAFSYPITGTYDDYLREQYGLTSVLIELSSNTSSEFSRNKAALWTMARS